MTRRAKPALTLLLGPAGSGKTQLSTEAFEVALKQSKNSLADSLLFILPTAEHRSRTIDLILRGGSGGFFQRRVTTIDRALKEFLKLGGLDYATDVTRRILIRDILDRSQFQYFKEAKDSRGFVELIARAIIELKENLIQPDELKKRLAALSSQFPEFAFKYEDLVHIYTTYEKMLTERSLTDQRDSLKLLEEGLGRGEFEAPELDQVWIDGFSDFSKLQLAFIEFLSRHANEVTVALTVADDSLRGSLFQIVSDTQTALEDMGFKPIWLKPQNYRAQNLDLKHVEVNLFREKRVKRIKSTGAIQIFEATGLLGEIEMIAREIKRLVKTHTYHLSDIAVLFRATDPYLQVIQSVFKKFELPYELHERFRLKNTPLARTLASFLDILSGGWMRHDVLNFLKSSYVHSDPETISNLELKALQKGIFKDRQYWLGAFPENQELQKIAVLEDELLHSKSISHFIGWIKKICATFKLLEFPSTSDEKTRFDRESARRIFLLLEELSQKALFADPQDMMQEFILLMDVDLFSIHSRDKNKVQIYNVSVARQKEYKVVFLAGLLEKHFPIQVKEDPVFSDAERRALNEKGEILKERLPRQAFERYLFYLAVTRAREHLILTYPRFNLEGKESLPSFYVEEVKRLFEGGFSEKHQHITDVLPRWEDVAHREEVEQLVIRDLWLIPDRKQKLADHHLAISLYNILIEEDHFRRLVSQMMKPIEGMLTDVRIIPQFQRDVWSPTWLEEYAECPFRFFSDRMLKLETQLDGIDIRRRGTILHDVLEHFFKWAKDEKRVIPFDEARDVCLNFFDELWMKEPLTGERFYRLELERKKMQEMILRLIRKEIVDKKPPISGLIPAYFEYEFNDLILKGQNRQIRLRGKIDRIDVDPSSQYALVIDYKSGKPFQVDTLKKGTSLQLPFYLMAAREKLGLKPLGGHLYSLKDTTSTGFHHQEHLIDAGVSAGKKKVFPEQKFEAVLDRAVQFSEKYVTEIEAGQIPVRPRNCVPYCAFSTVCRIEKWRLEHIYREIQEEDQKTAPEPHLKAGKIN